MSTSNRPDGDEGKGICWSPLKARLLRNTQLKAYITTLKRSFDSQGTPFQVYTVSDWNSWLWPMPMVFDIPQFGFWDHEFEPRYQTTSPSPLAYLPPSNSKLLSDNQGRLQSVSCTSAEQISQNKVRISVSHDHWDSRNTPISRGSSD